MLRRRACPGSGASGREARSRPAGPFASGSQRPRDRDEVPVGAGALLDVGRELDRATQVGEGVVPEAGPRLQTGEVVETRRLLAALLERLAHHAQASLEVAVRSSPVRLE